MLYVMLVGAYPFERPEDKHDNQKLQKMIQVRARCACCACVAHAAERERRRAVRRPDLRSTPGPLPPTSCLQRILRVEYDWPAHIKLSPECRDLMSRILVAGDCLQ